MVPIEFFQVNRQVEKVLLQAIVLAKERVVLDLPCIEFLDLAFETIRSFFDSVIAARNLASWWVLCSSRKWRWLATVFSDSSALIRSDSLTARSLSSRAFARRANSSSRPDQRPLFLQKQNICAEVPDSQGRRRSDGTGKKHEYVIHGKLPSFCLLPKIAVVDVVIALSSTPLALDWFPEPFLKPPAAHAAPAADALRLRFRSGPKGKPERVGFVRPDDKAQLFPHLQRVDDDLLADRNLPRNVALQRGRVLFKVVPNQSGNSLPSIAFSTIWR